MTDALRRRLLGGGACVLVGCAGVPTVRRGHPPRLLSPAPGVHVLPGSLGTATPSNRGWIANAGFVVGPAGVVVVDTGTSAAQGEALLAAVAGLTDRPVRLAILTHPRPEFIFGAPALQRRGIPVAMHRRAAERMAARCGTCLERLRQTLGEGEMAGTAMFRPDRVFDDGFATDVAGVPIEVLHFGTSSGPGDVAVASPAHGVVFAGALVANGRIPDAEESDADGWLGALDALESLRAGTLVPGWGPPGPAAPLIAATRRYVVGLEAAVRAAVLSGEPLLRAGEAAALPDFADWDQYATLHRRNASFAFLRLEARLLFER